MKIEEQACSLELAKRLKELGVKQESYFYWYEYMGVTKLRTHDYWPEISGEFPYSAFTVAELGMMLPDNFGSFKKYDKFKMAWHDKWTDKLLGKFYSGCCTEANARAKMLIYLLENGLIKNNNE